MWRRWMVNGDSVWRGGGGSYSLLYQTSRINLYIFQFKLPFYCFVFFNCSVWWKGVLKLLLGGLYQGWRDHLATSQDSADRVILLHQNSYLFKHHEPVDSPPLIMLPTKRETESPGFAWGPGYEQSVNNNQYENTGDRIASLLHHANILTRRFRMGTDNMRCTRQKFPPEQRKRRRNERSPLWGWQNMWTCVVTLGTLCVMGTVGTLRISTGSLGNWCLCLPKRRLTAPLRWTNQSRAHYYWQSGWIAISWEINKIILKVLQQMKYFPTEAANLIMAEGRAVQISPALRSFSALFPIIPSFNQSLSISQITAAVKKCKISTCELMETFIFPESPQSATNRKMQISS